MRRSLHSLSLLWPTGMRVRLTLWYLAIITLLFVVFSGIIARTLTNEANTQEEAVLASGANQLGATDDATSCSIALDESWQSSTPPIKPQPPPSKSNGIGKGLLLGPNAIAVLFDANGMPCKNTTNGTPQVYGLLTANGLADLRQLVFGQLHYLVPGGIDAWPLEVQTAPTGSVVTASYSVYVTRVGGTGTGGRLLVVASQFDPNQSLRSLAPALLVAGPLTLLVAAVGGYLLATRAMRPVRLITRTAREIGERDLDRRLNLRSRDELG
jgi:two-component system, OmpR family, sensor kinase